MTQRHPTPRSRCHPLAAPLIALTLALLAATHIAPLAAAPLPTLETALPAVTADRGRLLAGDTPFIVRGVNYIRPTTAPTSCPELHFGADQTCPWDHAAIVADLDRFQALGVNTVRIFLNYYVFGGARAGSPGYRINGALAHLSDFVAAANRRGIYVLPVLLAKYPQDRFDAASMQQAFDLHVRPVVRHLAGRPGILAWDLFNEPDIGSPIDQRCWDWDNGDFPLCLKLANERKLFLDRLHYEVKWLDPERLTTIGMGFAKSYFRPRGAEIQMAYLVDFYSFHYYDNEPYDSGRYAAHWYYGAGFPADLQRSLDELAALQLDKPVVVTELGFPSGPGTLRSSQELRRDLRVAWQLLREQAADGMVLWPFQTRPEELVGDLFN